MGAVLRHIVARNAAFTDGAREAAVVRFDWALLALLSAIVKLLQAARFTQSLGDAAGRRRERRRAVAERELLHRLEQALRPSDAGWSYRL